MMKVRDPIRVLVLKSNTFWPLYCLNKVPYELAIQVFIRAFKRFPEIKSIYLRHGMTESNWVPGLSDIDLTLIVDSNLTVEKEFFFLKCLWEKYERIRKFFPMLGEVDILNEKHIRTWTKFTIRGYESRNWKLVYGTEAVGANYAANPERLIIDSLNHAITIYLGYFLTKFYQREGSAYLVAKEIERLAAKILIYANKYNARLNREEIEYTKFHTRADTLHCIIKGLEESIKHSTLPGIRPGFEQGGRSWLRSLDSHNVALESQSTDFREPALHREEIKSIILSNFRSFIVLHDGLNASAIKDCVNTLRRVVLMQEVKPIIVTTCVFDYMLRVYMPYGYTHLIGNRAVPFGEDVLLDIRPPDKYYFIKNQVEQAINVLTFPQTQIVISPTKFDQIAEKVLSSNANRALFLKMYLEKGLLRPWHRENVAECEKHYPDHVAEIEKLKKRSRTGENGSLSLEWFRLFRGMANDIDDAVYTSDQIASLCI